MNARLISAFSVATLAINVASGPARADDPRRAVVDQAKLAQVGRVLAEENCKRCHAITMDDTSTHPQAPPFRDVVQRYPSENLAEALAEGIVSGHPDMPVFTFEPDEIEGFIAYLDSLGPPAEKPK
ncbi:MAG: cytochrome c [Hyphomicrobiaceae bacterium]